MSNLLLSSRAFCHVTLTHAFLALVSPVDRTTAKIVIIVNSVNNGKKHPKMLELQQTVRRLGFVDVQLLDVLTDDLTVLDTATAIILNGGYEFLLLENLRQMHLLQRLRQLALAGKPIYGISAGAILLGPDLDLYAQLYPEDNTERLTTTTAIGATTIRIYPHYEVHCELNPQLPHLIADWERQTGVSVTCLTNDQGLLLQGSRVQLIERSSS
ncbi:Type 1 glutamine amidotransferase-like domain-containing protein [Lactiplantibacillus sp. DA1]|uniref:Type 1 glutamine amidotransferase-like domain-containing protein n=1 Tax=Lactiplantibacillus sp. DA1 TaxID=3079857 RepID=UPI00292A667E|nr:Type 1 glutamine amidotransferase-like domain-containing protein [Lactiplantibacillus sp. DA1]MDV0430871.1 Type 1 glutamine amidotransferase-like domain-containing protein [Lactiplantibacillus sp. DA1]